MTTSLTVADLTDTQLAVIAAAVMAEPACAHPRCADGIHFRSTVDPATGESDEEGYCPLDGAA